MYLPRRNTGGGIKILPFPTPSVSRYYTSEPTASGGKISKISIAGGETRLASLVASGGGLTPHPLKGVGTRRLRISSLPVRGGDILTAARSAAAAVSNIRYVSGRCAERCGSARDQTRRKNLRFFLRVFYFP